MDIADRNAKYAEEDELLKKGLVGEDGLIHDKFGRKLDPKTGKDVTFGQEGAENWKISLYKISI